MFNRIWRGGMIGAGAWSETQLRAWDRVNNAKIVALCDRHPDRREPVVKQFKITRSFDNFEAMLDNADLDFVDICTRPYSHASLIKQAADRKLPVLCQKPFCTSMVEAQEVVAYCRQKGVRLMINENYRWQGWYRQVKNLLDAGVLGRLFFARLYHRSRFTYPKFDHSQAYLAKMPRLAVYEMGVHYLDTFRFLFGDPEAIFTRLHHISPLIQGEDVQLITLNYKEMTALINHSWASVAVPGLDRLETANGLKPPPRLEIDGTEGTLILMADGSLHLFTDTDHRQWHFSENVRPKAHIAAQRHFVDCLVSGAEFETSGEDTLKTMALVYACYLSAEENRVVDPKALL